jgi:hypothetical protein
VIVEIDGQSYEFPDDASESEIAEALGGMAAPPEQEPQGSGGASATLGAARALPAIKQGAARFAANHPAATQKIIGAGISTMAGGAGAAVGGVPGAVVGASIRGVTPAQTVIRETAGRMAGEAPAVARQAGQALGIQNYAKETTGLRLRPTDIINRPNAENALKHYANSQEKDILRLYGPSGEVVSGPSAVDRIPTPKQPGMASKALSGIGRLLSYASAGAGATDFAQTVEPNRKDIGVMGIGASGPMDPWRAQQAAYRAKILAALGLQ